MAAEVGTEFWYDSHADKAPRPLQWSVDWPVADPGFRKVPLPERTVALLRFDEGQGGLWLDEQGTRWELIYLRWLPGKVWVQLASDHSPSICLPAIGRELISTSQTAPCSVSSVPLQFQVYQFRELSQNLFVFYCLWSDGAQAPVPPAARVTQVDRFLAAWRGQRNPGQRVLEIAVWGLEDQREAEAALLRQLKRLIQVHQ